MAFYRSRLVRAYQLQRYILHKIFFKDVYYINFPDDKLWQKALGLYPQSQIVFA